MRDIFLLLSISFVFYSIKIDFIILILWFLIGYKTKKIDKKTKFVFYIQNFLTIIKGRNKTFYKRFFSRQILMDQICSLLYFILLLLFFFLVE